MNLRICQPSTWNEFKYKCKLKYVLLKCVHNAESCINEHVYSACNIKTESYTRSCDRGLSITVVIDLELTIDPAHPRANFRDYDFLIHYGI